MHKGQNYQDFVKRGGGGAAAFSSFPYNNSMNLGFFSQNLQFDPSSHPLFLSDPTLQIYISSSSNLYLKLLNFGNFMS